MAFLNSSHPIVILFLSIQDQLKRRPRSIWIKFLFHPFLLAASTLVAWPKSLLNSSKLFYGQWERYHGFTAFNSLNSLFYRTQWVNINNYGRNNTSPTLGLGQHPLSNIWHLSNIASYFYAYAGASTTLLGVIWMTLGNLIWLEASAQPMWVLLVTALFFFSSTMYLMAFERQNYQMLGWAWLPICFFGFMTQHYFIAAGSFLIASGLSLTAFVFCSPLLFIHALLTHNLGCLLAIIPAAIFVIVTKYHYIFSHKKNWAAISQLAGLLGASKKNIRYTRINKLSSLDFCFLGMYSLSILFLWLGKEAPPYFPIYALIIFCANRSLVRIADIESTILFFVFMTLSEAMVSEPSYFIALGLLIAFNPLNGFLALASDKWFSVSTYAPFDLKPILDKLRCFFNLKTHEKVLFVFSDPEDKHAKIFDTYRVIIEAAFYVAAEKKIHLFPDWHAILETNYQGSPSFWGKEPEEVLRNLNEFSTRYALIYQDAGTALDDKWSKNFKLVSEYDWTTSAPNVAEEFLNYQKKKLPKWFLLEKL